VNRVFLDLARRLDHDVGHILLAGVSGSGKTQGLGLVAREKMGNPLTGLHVVDPDGQLCPMCCDYLASPRTPSAVRARMVHYLYPASPTHTFALPLLHVPERTLQRCVEQALRTLTIFEQAVTVGAGDYGPRLSKLFFLGCLGLAVTGRPLIDLPDLFTRGSSHLRSIIGDQLPYRFLADEWGSLDLLSDRVFLEYRDPLMSRLMPIFGNPILRRLFGPQPPIDIAATLRQRDIVLLNLGGLEHKDAVLVGKAYVSLLYHAALQREPDIEPHACVIIDEVFDYVTVDLARGFDRLRKRNIQLCIALQRLGQLQ